ncbi:MAG: hypothetical protein HQ541_11880 [Mariniphaga sp.]|nr:hypothetical protein [Mariniphaga sp.]
MKSIIFKSVLFVTIALLSVMGAMAQRIIKGTVYKEGEPAAGITVEAHRGGGTTMMTSFDGLYEVEADAKTKWVKFTFIDESKRYIMEENSGDNIDFYFDGIKPAGNSGKGGVNLKSIEELIKEQDFDFMNELSLYQEFEKQNDYKSALPHWEKLYNGYPKSTKNLYIHGVKFYKDLLNKASTLEEKEKNLKSMMEVYDKRIKNFQERGSVLGRKSVSWLEHYMNNEDVSFEDKKEGFKSGYEWLKESAELEGDETEIAVIALLMNVSTQLYKFGELPKEEIVKNYEFCTSTLNQKLNIDGEINVEEINTVLDFVDIVFTKSGAADCDALISIYEPQFEENSDDIKFITIMLQRLRRAKCDESELFNKATDRQYELEPSAEAAFNMARRNINRDPEKAKEYYMQAMEQETDEELLSTYYYEYGLFIYAKEQALQEARTYARKALEINSKYCEALILIGDIYIAASPNYGESDFEKSTVFWLVVDYYNRAARASNDCIADASKKASDYKEYFPGKEDVFFQGLSESESYKIGGWINETTKVRF